MLISDTQYPEFPGPAPSPCANPCPKSANISSDRKLTTFQSIPTIFGLSEFLKRLLSHQPVGHLTVALP